MRSEKDQLKGQTVDQLLSDMEQLRRKKAELERREKEVVAVLESKLKEQQERLQKLGFKAGVPQIRTTSATFSELPPQSR